MLRPPAVAGRFYPADPKSLAGDLARLIPASSPPGLALGVMVPHAGYQYSGGVAGQTFARVAIPPEVLILGPNHHGLGAALALYPAGSWATPLGAVPVDAALTAAIQAAAPRVVQDSVAHRFEHSLEVQVPFLMTLSPTVRIAALCIGRSSLETLLALGDALAVALASRPVRPLLVASTDMTHFESAAAAERKDRLALEQVLRLDPEGLYRTVVSQRISMCGVLPTVVMLRAALALGARKAELVAYTNSGAVTGDLDEVVGYAGVVVS